MSEFKLMVLFNAIGFPMIYGIMYLIFVVAGAGR
jgi:hypothetical protein